MSNGIPRLIVIDDRSKRETIEFCVARCDQHRCMLVKGHEGPHEALAYAGTVRWFEDAQADPG